MDVSKVSGSKTAARVRIRRIASTGSSGKRSLDDGEEPLQEGKYSETNAKKWLMPRGDDDDDVGAPPAKKGKVTNSTSAKPKNGMEPDPAPPPRTTKDVKGGENLKATGKGEGKGRAKPDQDIVEPAEEEEENERLPERVSKPKKRKKEEGNYDDRPRKVVKFSELEYVF